MSITRNCAPGDIAVTVSTSAGEYLLYKVEADDTVTYTLESDPGGTILSSASCPSPCEKRWPDEPPGAGDYEHTFGMAFTADGRCAYKVEHYTPADQLIRVVKNCSFTGGPGQYYEPLTVTVP